MTTKREEEIRGVLADHTDTQLLLMAALKSCKISMFSVDLWTKVVQVMIACEKRQAYEIDLIYSHGNENEAEHCNSCGQWLIAEFCQCVMEQEQLTAQLQQSIERAK